MAEGEIVDSLITELGFRANTKVIDRAEKKLKALEKSANATARATDVLADEQLNLSQKLQGTVEKEQKLRREQVKLTKAIKKAKNPTQEQQFALKKVDRQLQANSRSAQKLRNDLAQLGIQQSRLAKQGRMQGRQQKGLGGALKGAKGGGGLEGISAVAGPAAAGFAAVTAAAVATGAAIATVVETGARMESLRARLKTVEGSVEKASTAFSLLQDLAKSTPFELEDVTNAYVRLKSVGIQPTRESLTAFGNIAAAQGKPIIEFIEAVTDATTGEFERLKEFGIKASSQGEKVAFTMGGITTTVGKNAREIEGFLKGLGETRFAGAMDDQMTTFNGLVSNLKDNWTSLLDQMGQMGVLDEAKLLLKEISGTMSEDLVPIIADMLISVLRDVREMFVFLRDSGASLADKFKGLAEVSEFVSTALAPFVLILKVLIEALIFLIDIIGTLAGVLNDLIDFILALGSAVSSLLTPTSEASDEWTGLAKAWETAATFGNDLLATINETTASLKGQAGAVMAVSDAVKDLQKLTGGVSGLTDKELQALRKAGGAEGTKAEAEIRKRVAAREKADAKTDEAVAAKKAKDKKAGRAGDVASRFDKLSDRQLASFASDPNVSKKLRDKAEKEQTRRSKKKSKKGATAGKKLRDATLIADINKQIDKNAREIAQAEAARGLRSGKLTAKTAGAFETRRFKEVGDKQRSDFEGSGKLPAGIAQDIRQVAALPSINDLAGRTQAPVISNTIIKTDITGNTFTAEISGAFATSPAEAVTLSLMEFRKQSGKLMAEAVPMFRTQELR